MSKISDERLAEIRKSIGTTAMDLISGREIEAMATELQSLRSQPAGDAPALDRKSFDAGWEWANKLRRSAEPQQEEAVAWLPDNLFSHRASWLRAMDRLIELEPESTEPDMGEKGYWRHERQAMLDMYADLDAHPTPVQKVQESQTVSEEKWHDLRKAANSLLNTLWQEVYTGSKTYEENWSEMERRWPQSKWLHEAARDAALEPAPPSTPLGRIE